jgi:hypothetical protein
MDLGALATHLDTFFKAILDMIAKIADWIDVFHVKPVDFQDNLADLNPAETAVEEAE